MAFVRTTAINKLLKLKKFVKGVQGGTSAGKTYGILPILINKACKVANLEISVVSESVPHLKRGAMKDFIKIMKETGRWNRAHWNATDFKYTFANGSYIEFFSADDDSKLRGARRDYLYINECNNVSFHAYTELAARTKEGIYLDWNPTSSFWFHEELQHDDDVDYIVLTYEDNEACPEASLNFINKAKKKGFVNPNLKGRYLLDPENTKSPFWANWYKVYGLGMMGSLEGVIFQFTLVDELPLDEDGYIDADLIAHGLDFGFTNDPSALTSVYRKGKNDLYLDEGFYNTGMTNRMIVNEFGELQIERYDDIIADSAEPKSIKEISNAGYNIVGAKKGKDSIKASINILQQYNIFVTKRSLNLIKELRGYVWAKDKTGKTLNVPIGVNDHCIAGVRYVALNKLAFFDTNGNYSFA